MKSEPSIFSIDDLAQRHQKTEPWTGVRNYQVRNWLRDTIQPGDRAFFYHSSCATAGIVGTIEITTKGYIDSTAFDPQSMYYDAKSDPKNPRWYCVDVRLLEKFKSTIMLSELRKHPQLQDLQILRNGNRLSITPITGNEWKMILQLAKQS